MMDTRGKIILLLSHLDGEKISCIEETLRFCEYVLNLGFIHIFERHGHVIIGPTYSCVDV